MDDISIGKQNDTENTAIAETAATAGYSRARDIIGSAHTALSVYSRLPMPYMDMKGSRPGYVFCFFPLVGVLMGAVLLLWRYICELTGLGQSMTAAVVTVCMPVAVTGGIHIDGYMDCVDAYSSYRDRERRLEILKDPHIGAFAAIWTILYMLIYTALIYDMPADRIGTLVTVYITERILLGLLLMRAPVAKQTGMLAAMMEATAKKATAAVLVAELIACVTCSAYMTYVSCISRSAQTGAEADIRGAMSRLAALYIVMSVTGIYGSYKACRTLGGMTGDTCGYTIQLMELAGVAVLALM